MNDNLPKLEFQGRPAPVAFLRVFRVTVSHFQLIQTREITYPQLRIVKALQLKALHSPSVGLL